MTHDHEHVHTHTHPHDHNHSHDHDHGHDHSHSHDHGHSHPHPHPHGAAAELTFAQKLEKLFSHWIDHNESHKDTFFTWAERSRENGLKDVADKIEKVGQLSQQVTEQLKSALNDLKNS